MKAKIDYMIVYGGFAAVVKCGFPLIYKEKAALPEVCIHALTLVVPLCLSSIKNFVHNPPAISGITHSNAANRILRAPSNARQSHVQV